MEREGAETKAETEMSNPKISEIPNKKTNESNEGRILASYTIFQQRGSLNTNGLRVHGFLGAKKWHAHRFCCVLLCAVSLVVSSCAFRFVTERGRGVTRRERGGGG